MKRIFACILAMLMLAGCLMSCEPTVGGEVTTPEAENTSAPEADVTTGEPSGSEETPSTTIEPVADDVNVPKLNPTSVKLAKNNLPTFKIIYAENGFSYATVAKTLAESMFEKFFKVFGYPIEIGNDINIPDSRDTVEILVGVTNREESDIALKFANGGNGFVVKAVGNKVVINAYTDKKLEAAVDYFFTEFVEKNSTKNLTFTSENDYASTHNYPLKNYTVAGYSYKPYTIVVPENASYSELRLARKVQYLLATEIGALLDIVYDNETGHNETFEILIGNTKRTTISASSNWNYKFAVTNGKLELVAGSVYSYEYLGSYVESSMIFYLKDAKSLNCGVVKDVDIEKALKGDHTDHAIEKNGEIRMVVHNVWGWNENTCVGIWNYAPVRYNSASQRNLMMAEIYSALDADIITLQEYTNRLMRVDANYDISPIMESLGYAQILGKKIDGIYTATPIFYKTDKFELLEWGITKFPGSGGGHDKFATWGVFKQKSDGKVFGAVSVHMAYQGGEQGEAYRLEQVPIVMDIVDKIIEKHNCPVMVGGDMNCNINSAPFKLYMESGCQDVHDLASQTDSGKSFDGGPNWDDKRNIFTMRVNDIGQYAAAIDHLIVKGTGITFNTYDYLTDNASAAIADHMPLLVDFDLN